MTQVSVVAPDGGEAIQRYFRDLGQMIADGRPLTPQNTEQAMSRYATETAADYAERPR